MLLEHLRSRAAQDRPQREGDDDGVVELAGDGDEVGDDVEGKHQIAQQGDDEGPVPTGSRASPTSRRKSTMQSGMNPASARASERRPASTRTPTKIA